MQTEPQPPTIEEVNRIWQELAGGLKMSPPPTLPEKAEWYKYLCEQTLAQLKALTYENLLPPAAAGN